MSRPIKKLAEISFVKKPTSRKVNRTYFQSRLQMSENLTSTSSSNTSETGPYVLNRRWLEDFGPVLDVEIYFYLSQTTSYELIRL